MPFYRVSATTCGWSGRALGAATLALALATLVAATAAATTTVYVDNQSATASHAGPGTEASPFRTIGAALAAARGPNVVIVVRPGVYREQVTVPASGAPGLPFVLRAERPGVVIDGADDFGNAALWSPADGTVWRAAGVTWSPSQVFVDGARLTPALPPSEVVASEDPDWTVTSDYVVERPVDTSPAEWHDLPPNTFKWVAGEGLYVNLDGHNPGTRRTLVGRRSHGVKLSSKAWVTIEGFEIVHTEDRAIHLRECSNVLVARNRVRFAGSYGIEGVNSANLVIDGNVVSDCGSHGIGLVRGSRVCVVRYNESFRNAVRGARIAKGIYLYGAPDNTLYGNRVHHNQDTGMQFNQGSNNCIAYANQSWYNGDHGYDHLDVKGTVHSNNVAFGNYKDGFSIEGDSPGTQVYNCISVENGKTTRGFNLWVNRASSVGFRSDHNIFWNSGGHEPVKYVDRKYARLEDYQAASGQDLRSIQADPMLVDGGAGAFLLAAGSPAIDAGASGVPGWLDTDAAGNGRMDDPHTADLGVGPVTYSDIGAFEYAPRIDLVPTPPPPLEYASDAPQPVETELGATELGPAGRVIRGERLALSSGYPNPTEGAVEFALEMPEAARIEWMVFDLQGRVVWSAAQDAPAGRTVLRWDGATGAGGSAATGVYLVRARAVGAQVTRRVVRL